MSGVHALYVRRLAELLDTAVQVAVGGLGGDDGLALEREVDVKYAVGARVLRAHVEHEPLGVQHRVAWLRRDRREGVELGSAPTGRMRRAGLRQHEAVAGCRFSTAPG